MRLNPTFFIIFFLNLALLTGGCLRTCILKWAGKGGEQAQAQINYLSGI